MDATSALTTGDNVWFDNPNDQGYRQRLGMRVRATDELLVERNGDFAYSGKAVINISSEDDSDLVVGTDKVTLNLHPDRVIVSQDDPPDAAVNVATGDRGKLYFHVNSVGRIKSISYVRGDVDPHIFHLSTEQYQPVTEVYRGFRLDGHHGLSVAEA